MNCEDDVRLKENNGISTDMRQLKEQVTHIREDVAAIKERIENHMVQHHEMNQSSQFNLTTFVAAAALVASIVSIFWRR